jgi:uncharacterized protein (DUF302 family)
MPEALGYEVKLDQPFEQALVTVTEALKAEGFGVLTRIDVQATLKEKIGADFRPYVILGACNPGLAYRALQCAPEVGLLLPCNVTVEAQGSARCLVRIANPVHMVQAVNQPDNPEMQSVADDAQAKIEKVVELLRK